MRRTSCRTLCSIVLLITSLVFPVRTASAYGPSVPEPSPPQSSSAVSAGVQQKFDEGIADVEQGKFESGCPKLAYVYEETTGAGALFELGRCLVKGGKIFSGTAKLEVYRRWYKRWNSEITANRQSIHQGFDAEADKMIEESKPEIPLLTIQSVPECILPNCRVTLDGNRIGPSDLRQPLPVDPGAHEVIVEQDGARAVTTSVTLEKRGRKVVQVSRPGKPLTAVLIAGGLGVAGMVAGIVAGVVTMGEARTIKADCDEFDYCTKVGLDAVDRSKATGIVSTVGFAFGAAGLVGAGLALGLQPKPAPIISVSRRPVGMHVSVAAQGGITLNFNGVW